MAVLGRISVVSAVVVGLVLAATSPAWPARARPSTCAAAHSRTILISHEVRVYRVGNRYYGCLRRTGRRSFLGWHRRLFNLDRTLWLEFQRAAIGGDWVAWTWTSQDLEVGDSSAILERNLRSGANAEVIFDIERPSVPRALAVSSRGFLAWLRPTVTSTYLAGIGPSYAAVHGFGSGPHADIAAETAQGVSILAGRGDGTFEPAVTHKTPSPGDGQLAVSDLNGDGIADVVAPVAGLGPSSGGPHGGVEVLIGSAHGTFGRPAEIPIPRSDAVVGISSVLASDLNRDGRTDLVAVDGSAGQYGNGVFVLRGRGDGKFSAPVFYKGPTGGAFHEAVVVADLNGDGIPDIAGPVTRGFGTATNRVAILYGKGDGTFAGAATVRTPSAVDALAAGDLNHDGKADLVVAGAHGIDVLLGRGDGRFSAAGHVPVESNAVESLAIGDLRGNGNEDVVAGFLDVGGVDVLLGRGDGTLAPARHYSTDGASTHVSLGDLRGDGRRDIVVANSEQDNVSVLLNRGDGNFRPVAPATGVFVHDSSGTHELGYGQRIAMLRFTGGSRVNWIADGVVRHALLR